MVDKRLKSKVVIGITVTLMAIVALVSFGQSSQQRPVTLTGVTFNKSQIGSLDDDLSAAGFRQTSDGFLFYGYTNVNPFAVNKGSTDAYIYRLTSSGGMQWAYQFGSTGTDEFYSAVLCSNGDALVCGKTSGSLFGMPGNTDSWFLARISSTGSLSWVKRITTQNIDSAVIEDSSDTRILLQIDTNTAGSYQSHLELYDIAGTYLCSSQTPSNKGYELIKRNGTTYQTIVDNDTIIVFDGSLQVVSSVDVQNSIQGVQLTNHTQINGVEYAVGIESELLGGGTVKIVQVPNGTVTSVLSLPRTENNYRYEVLNAGSSGTKGWFVVGAKGACMTESQDDTRYYESQMSAALYETDGVTATKLFDIYTPPAEYRPHMQVVKRTDGSYACLTSWGEGGYGTEAGLGTVIDIFGYTGAKIGSYCLPEYTDKAKTIDSLAIIVGLQSNNTTNTKNTYYATLPNVATPTFSPAPGTYSGTQSVSVSCATTGATIRYTTDGSEPTETSTQYTAPISVSTNKTVKARAFKTAILPSLRSDAKYTVKK
ncbi:MAG: chitobiase/beta-hexosaminidase C-terminal domain-containing protein [Armatimonadota bacterium]